MRRRRSSREPILAGGVVIAAGFGYLSSVWVGLGLAVLGVAVATASALLQRIRPLRA